MKIIPLSEGSFTVDRSKKFIPFTKDTDDLSQRSRGSLLVEIQPFAIVTSRDVLLMDTGLGFSLADNQLQIHKNLALHGINSSDVTKVLLTHLHKDHSGGIAYAENKELSFANADYYINEEEWNYAFRQGHPSYITEDYRVLEQKSNLKFTNGKGVIDDYIGYETTGGHCPFHQVFWIKENDEIIFFGGDVAPQIQQMKNRFKAKYDDDGQLAMELRGKWWQQGAEEGWTFLFYHDIKSAVHKFTHP